MRAQLGSNLQNKTPQTHLSPGTLVEQPLPRKFVQKHTSEGEMAVEWPEWATESPMFKWFPVLSPTRAISCVYCKGKNFFGTL